MRPKRCNMCPKRAREGFRTCSPKCAETRKWKQKSLDRHRSRSKVPGTFRVTVEDWLDIVRAFNYRCAYCNNRGKMTVDHVIPLSRGGRHCTSNIVPACLKCNHSKGSLTVAEWRNWTNLKKLKNQQKMTNIGNKSWSITASRGIKTNRNYNSNQAPIFDQLVQEMSDKIVLERIILTVDHYGVLV